MLRLQFQFISKVFRGLEEVRALGRTIKFFYSNQLSTYFCPYDVLISAHPGRQMVLVTRQSSGWTHWHDYFPENIRALDLLAEIFPHVPSSFFFPLLLMLSDLCCHWLKHATWTSLSRGVSVLSYYSSTTWWLCKGYFWACAARTLESLKIINNHWTTPGMCFDV